MLKKAITFENYAEPPVEVTQEFYFNFTKLEVIEMLEVDELEKTLERLTQTEDSKEAYALFKKLILSAYGERTPEGGFTKEDENGRPLSRKFEQSPACSELIIEFLQNPKAGGEFVEACLPPKMVAEAKAAQAQNPSKSQLAELVEKANELQQDPATAIAPGTPPVGQEEALQELRTVQEKAKTFEDYTREELLVMDQAQFQSLLPANPKDFSRDQLMVAFERKNKA
jgi:hypothetical protein